MALRIVELMFGLIFLLGGVAYLLRQRQVRETEPERPRAAVDTRRRRRHKRLA